MIEVDFTEALERLQTIVDELVSATPNFILGLIVFVLFLILGLILQRAVQAAIERSRYRRRNLGLIVSRIIEWLIIILGLTLALVLIFPTFSISELIQIFGFLGVAVGFAFRDVLQNFLVGIILLVSEPFRVGDQIIAGDYRGTVEDITTRATAIRTYDGQRIVIPNNDLYKNAVTVQTAFERRRIDREIHLTYDSDLDVAKELILNAIRSADEEVVMSSPPPTVVVSQFSEYYVNLLMRWWIKPPLYHHMIRSQDIIHMAVKRAIDADDRVALAVPEHRIRLQDQPQYSAE